MRVSALDLAATGAIAVVVLVVVFLLGGRRGRASLRQRLSALAARLGASTADPDPRTVEEALTRVERATDRAAEAVAESSADAIRLRRALDALPQAVIVCDERGEPAFRNTRAIALMGNRHGDALAAQAVDELLANTAPGSSEERTLELYGPPRRTLNVRTQSLDNGQRALGVIAVIEDVSERRRLEEVRRDFVANVSHELKTPMGALGLLAETLLAETEPEVSQRLAQRIHTEAFRISRIIDDLLDLSRIESEESPPREPVLVNLVMAEAAERVRAAAEQRSVEVVLDEPSPPVAVLGDRRQLTSAIYNLLENAVKFSYEGGTVECRGEATADEVTISVRDKGIGIPARDLERIFERFYRVDHGRSRSTGGTGLGLAIVRHVAQNHHGTVHVDSREGEGASFSLRLPLQPRVEG
ncbi:MAG: ATP-binding protein [Actinomycetota bacterium]|jgi:two-component system sensor histidine kinase SenX3|nr:ATP-binding protein [Actinomycetota bacterium]